MTRQVELTVQEFFAAEGSKWERLLAQQIEDAGLPAPERQYHIYMPGASHPCRADFCWPSGRLIVEVQGGQWVRGRHTRGGKSFETECRKVAWYGVLGFVVLPVTPGMIEDGYAINCIRKRLEEQPRKMAVRGKAQR